MQKNGIIIKISGIVQGVGFRPFVYRIANENEISGQVRNTSAGIVIHASGSTENLNRFISHLKNNPPRMAQIDRIEIENSPIPESGIFQILPSVDDKYAFLPVSADIAVCAECLAEMQDPDNRRYQYPFINCTNCGPRFTIVESIPYDRLRTSMRSFPFCPDCATEYSDPTDRRYHAEPIACPQCGPKILYLDRNGHAFEKEKALDQAINALRNGKIGAIKNIGGFHLVCDTHHEQAVATLRKRKNRVEKAFALMAQTTEIIERYCHISEHEKKALEQPSAPIVLLRKKQTSATLPENIAPEQNTLGFMLCSAPLQFLLLERLKDFTDVLIMTSANLSEEPIAYQGGKTDCDKLLKLADFILDNDRAIISRIDDSVLRVNEDGKSHILRRARGFAPRPINLSEPSTQIFAAGADLKNTFCLSRDRSTFISHHIGDLENAETLEAFLHAYQHSSEIFRIRPKLAVCDQHPRYLSAKAATKISMQAQIPLLRVQHHHAHIASVLAEHHRFDNNSVIGVALDGTGYGSDGSIWGGEFLIVNQSGFVRAAFFEPFPLIGADSAIRKPQKIAAGLLLQAGLPSAIPEFLTLTKPEIQVIEAQFQSGTNCTQTSAVGRIFDAVSALCGICKTVTYEGQAAILLENCCDVLPSQGYPFALNGNKISLQAMIAAVICDLRHKKTVAEISAAFHRGIADAIINMCVKLRIEREISVVALSGGVWQNEILLQLVTNGLEIQGFEVLLPIELPFNDGGICFGQAAIGQAHLNSPPHGRGGSVR